MLNKREDNKADKTAKQQAMKKQGLVKKGVKYLSFALLTLLLIAAIIFQAPWKVITLLVIILLACTALPKPYRKWFWLSVGLVIIALIIWVFLPDDNEGWQPYTFDEELAALEAKHAIPDSENAATIYKQLLDSYDSNSFYSDLPESEVRKVPMREPWLSGEHPKVAEWLEKHQTTISILLNASRIEKCRFTINANVLTYTMDRLSPMRKWAYLLISAANNDIAEGRTENGLEKYIAVLQMGNHQRQQPPLIDFMVGVALEALSISQFKSFIVTGDAAEEHLIVIEKALGVIKYDWSTDFPRFIEHEKLFAKNFWGMFYVVNPEGNIRLNPGIARRAMMAQLPEDMKDEIALKYWLRKLMKATTILAWLYMPSTPHKAGAIIDAAYERCYAMAEPGFDWQHEPQKLLTLLTKRKFNYWIKFNFRYFADLQADMAEESFYSIHDIYLQAAAQQRGGQIIIALRRYKNETGHWPDSLDEISDLLPLEALIDPTNGGSFVYKLTEENFTLYSKGKNNIDENGQYNTKFDEQEVRVIIEEDDRLIWPRKSRKTKEENADAEQ